MIAVVFGVKPNQESNVRTNHSNYREHYKQNFSNFFYIETLKLNKSLGQAYCLKVTNDIENIAEENIKKIYAKKTKEEQLVSPYDEETTNFICD